MTTEAPQGDEQAIVARAGRYYRNTRYIMTFVLVALGGWFGYDGYIGWPKLNERIRAVEAERDQAVREQNQLRNSQLVDELAKLGKEKTAWDIGLQKVLFFTLPPLGIIVLLRALYNSRGEYRLEGGTLCVPGHPPVPFENVTEIDRRLWDRKGIAYIHYDLGDGRKGRLRLDDFVYERPPTDEIFKRIEEFVEPRRPDDEPEAMTHESEA